MPYWFDQLRGHQLSFDQAKNQYVLAGVATSLLSPSLTIPDWVPRVGGKRIGANVGFTFSIASPLNTDTEATATAYAGVNVTYDDKVIFTKNYDPKIDNLLVTPGTQLDNRTLEPVGDLNLTFALTAKENIAGAELVSETLLDVGLFNVHYGIKSDLDLSLKANATAVFRHGATDGELASAGTSSVDLRLDASLTGEVNFSWSLLPGVLKALRTIWQRFKLDSILGPLGDKLPSLTWKNSLTGTLGLHEVTNYAGSSSTPVVIPVHFDGSIDYDPESIIVFNVAGHDLISLNLTKIFGTPAKKTKSIFDIGPGG